MFIIKVKLEQNVQLINLCLDKLITFKMFTSIDFPIDLNINQQQHINFKNRF